MVDALVELRGVAKRFGEQVVLTDVGSTIAEGEVFGYIGPNGAGKTTTLRILAGLMSRFDGGVPELADRYMKDLAGDRQKEPSSTGKSS